MKRSYQHRKESEEMNKMITLLQAHIRGYLVRQEMKNKIQRYNRQALYAIKIQVSFLFTFIFIYLF